MKNYDEYLIHWSVIPMFKRVTDTYSSSDMTLTQYQNYMKDMHNFSQILRLFDQIDSEVEEILGEEFAKSYEPWKEYRVTDDDIDDTYGESDPDETQE